MQKEAKEFKDVLDPFENGKEQMEFLLFDSSLHASEHAQAAILLKQSLSQNIKRSVCDVCLTDRKPFVWCKCCSDLCHIECNNITKDVNNRFYCLICAPNQVEKTSQQKEIINFPLSKMQQLLNDPILKNLESVCLENQRKINIKFTIIRLLEKVNKYIVEDVKDSKLFLHWEKKNKDEPGKFPYF